MDIPRDHSARNRDSSWRIKRRRREEPGEWENLFPISIECSRKVRHLTSFRVDGPLIWRTRALLFSYFLDPLYADPFSDVFWSVRNFSKQSLSLSLHLFLSLHLLGNIHRNVTCIRWKKSDAFLSQYVSVHKRKKLLIYFPVQIFPCQSILILSVDDCTIQQIW